MSQANQLISTAPGGVDVSEAKTALNLAQTLRQQGKWYESYTQALETVGLAQSLIAKAASQTTTTTTASMSIQTTAQPSFSSQTAVLALVAVFVGVVVVVLYSRSKRKKEGPRT
jgi:hypothetical protein